MEFFEVLKCWCVCFFVVFEFGFREFVVAYGVVVDLYRVVFICCFSFYLCFMNVCEL